MAAKRCWTLFFCVTLLVSACSSGSKKIKTEAKAQPTAKDQRAMARPALLALQAGDFEKVGPLVKALLAKDPTNSTARGVSAIARYHDVLHTLWMNFRIAVEFFARGEKTCPKAKEDMATMDERRKERLAQEPLLAEHYKLLFAACKTGENAHTIGRKALLQTDQALEKIDADLATAQKDRKFSLELCLACWERDWNRNGRIDINDRLFFQIELDKDGKRFPKDDPRRNPTFHFDQGDIVWARAMVSFQRAAVNILLAYKWTELGTLVKRVFLRFQRGSKKVPTETRLKMAFPKHVAQGRQLILAGLQHADHTRRLYLAESDDDREWVPNPKQMNHPLPLPVDETLYATWAGVVEDLKDLVAGKTALSVNELAQLGDNQWEDPPSGFINIGGMLSQPKDIVFNLTGLAKTKRDKASMESTLTSLLGDYYVSQMKPTPLIKRLQRMKKEMSQGKESFSRKLRYLLWLN